MAKECLKKCPRILELSHPHAVGLFPSDIAVLNYQARALQEAKEDSDNCPGPIVRIMELKRGNSPGWITSETVVMCGLDQETAVNGQTETPDRIH